ncbi:MAG: glutamate--tRNA ligase [Actinomycetota bacterium]|nr:glutamate--tRNA ligase [Actinomycetota bacterium]
MTVRTRIAPAPSGYIHVGNARTALYNWLFARQQGGVFVLRVEDTDAKRATEEGFEGALEDLRWLGLTWDEGPGAEGEYGPYRQSERFERYGAATLSLLENGHAYRCYCTPEDVAARRAKRGGGPQGYDQHCRKLTEAERSELERSGRPSAVRFKVPGGRTISFDDVVRGRVETSSEQIGDFVIQRSDGSPTYLLAAGLDDMLMNITHIIRGEDLIPATPRQILLREGMGATDVPVFAHLPLLVDERGRPLSKRWGDVALRSYRERGFLASAMVNYLVLLGWSYDDRTNIFSVEELVERFSLERVGRNPAAFDLNKLEWLNLHYIKQTEPAELARELVPFCAAAGFEADVQTLEAVAPLLVERLRRLDEAPSMVRFLFQEVAPDDKARKVLGGQEEYLKAVFNALRGLSAWNADAIEDCLRRLAAERELKPKQAFQPIRAAVTGTLVSPPLFESLEILGRARTLQRIKP